MYIIFKDKKSKRSHKAVGIKVFLTFFCLVIEGSGSGSATLLEPYLFSVQIDVVPLKRIQSVLEIKPLDFKDMGPCGGFSIQYACYCDYYSMPYREEVPSHPL